MRFLFVVILTLATTIGFVTGGAGAKQSKPAANAGIDVKNLDRNVKPCQDFFAYANGGWITANPIPADSASWGLPQVLRDQNLTQLRSILDDASKSSPRKGSNDQKIGDYYYSVMDTKTRDAEGIKPLGPWLKRIDDVRDAKSLQTVFAYLASYNVDSPFGIGSEQDLQDSEKVIAAVGQGGFSLPERDYYFTDDDKSKSIRDEYVKHVSRVFGLMGEDAAKSAADAKVVMDIETRLAGASLKRSDLRNPANSYHLMSVGERKALTPNLDWEAYFEGVGLKAQDKVDIAHPKFFKEVDAMIGDVSIDNWKIYLRWRLVNFASPMLSTAFEQESFSFNSGVLSGTKEPPPLWKRAVSATSARLGEALGEVYVRQYFPAESKRRVKELVTNLRAALREDIQTLDWISEPTRKQALLKLDSLAEKIGYPDKWIDYSKLDVDRGAYALNMLRSQHWALNRDLEKVGKSVNRNEWIIPPQTINAGYIPTTNEIVFPAAIMQAPLFDANADDALNYGAIGAIIGHELTHGFDDQGAQFDAAGNFKRWWTPEDYEKFQARTNCVEAQFDALTLPDGTHLKGKLVKGEAIADLGGLKLAWLAYQKSWAGKPHPPVVNGFTAEQRFFLGFGQAWKGSNRQQFEALMVNTDPHPLGRFRLNGTVSNLPEFAQAFGCGESDTMVRKNRCVIW